MLRALIADFDSMRYRERNLTRWIILEPAARELYVDWEKIASEMVAILRLDSGAHPDDPRTTALVGELTVKSPEFARWWSQHRVLDRTWGTNDSATPSRDPSTSTTKPSTSQEIPTRPLFVYRAPTATPPQRKPYNSSPAGPPTSRTSMRHRRTRLPGPNIDKDPNFVSLKDRIAAPLSASADRSLGP